MKKIWYILFIITCIFLITSCNNDNSGSGETPGGNNNPSETPSIEAPVVKMDKDYYVIGEEINFIVENYDNLDDFKIEFDTDNGVRVNAGVITAWRAGEYTATITHKEDNTKQAVLDFQIYLKSFQLDATTYALSEGEKIEFWTVSLDGLYEKSENDFNFTVSDDALAKIEGNTLVAKKAGVVNIIATSKYNANVKAEIPITIADENSVFMIKPETELGQMQVGQDILFNISEGYKPDEFEWLSSDDKTARVTRYDTRVEVTGVKEGIATITCYKKDNPTIKSRYQVKVVGVKDVDYRAKLVYRAYEEIGVLEGKNDKGEWNNFQKYGAWYGNDGNPWCATFVSWAWYHAGLSQDLLLKYQGCTAGMEWSKEQGIWRNRGQYVPQTGDIIFFNQGNLNVSTHTGIVAYCDGTYVYTIEGNRSNIVGVWRIKLTNTSITGYATPDFPESTYRDDFSWIAAKQEDGSYLWTNVSGGDSTQ